MVRVAQVLDHIAYIAYTLKLARHPGLKGSSLITLMNQKKRLVLEGIAYIAYIAYINGITSMHEMHEIIAADALTPAARCRHRQQHQWQQQGASPNRGQVVKVNWTHEMTHVKHQVQPLFFLTHWDSPVSPSTTHFTKMV